MLRNVTLRFGAAPGEPPLGFSPGPMTVFVGPNNSGKSLALRELEALIGSGDPSLLHIVRSITPHLPDAETVERMVRSRGAEHGGEMSREFLSLFTLRLDGQTRLALTQPRLAGDLQANPANHLAALFKDDAARERGREHAGRNG